MGEDLMKRFLLLLALIATTGGALAHDQDRELRRASRQCRERSTYGLAMELGMPSVAKAYYWECMKTKGYVRED